jgi:hypothetical protein
MAITVQEDLVGGNRYHLDSKGMRFTRIFLVKGMDPANAANAALAVTAAGVPAYQQPVAVSGVSQFLYANVFDSVSLDGSRENFRVTVDYTSAEFSEGNQNVTLIEVSGSNQLKRIYKWPTGSTPGGNNDGALIYVGYDPGTQAFQVPIPASSVPDTATQSGPYYCTGSVEQLSPNTILTYSRWIRASPGNGPLSMAQAYRRKTNKNRWQGGAVGTWLCRQFDSVSRGTPFGINILFAQTISFEYDPDGWTQEALFENQIDGQVPQGIDITDGTNNGYTPVNYSQANFSPLGLPTVY